MAEYLDGGFNPRTRRACDELNSDGQLSASGFNPRTRRACDTTSTLTSNKSRVSIHARVERATSAWH